MKAKNTLFALYPKIDSNVKAPREAIKMRIAVSNAWDTALFFSKLEIYPSWLEEKKSIKPIVINNYLPRGETISLPELSIISPSKRGLYTIGFGLETWVYNYYTAHWDNLGILSTSNWGYIEVSPSKGYPIVVSANSCLENMPLIEKILNILRSWGINPTIVNIDNFFDNQAKILQITQKQIYKTDGIIAIVTPRDLSITEKLYQTFSSLGIFLWLEMEKGKRFLSDKPILFIIDERVKFEGLLEYPGLPIVFYHPAKLEVLEHRLAIVMPSFKNWITTRKKQGFFYDLRKAGVIYDGISCQAGLSENSLES